MQLFGMFDDLKVLGFVSIIFAVLSVSGLQLISTGIIGSYLTRVFKEVRDRPLYLVEELRSSDEN